MEKIIKTSKIYDKNNTPYLLKDEYITLGHRGILTITTEKNIIAGKVEYSLFNYEMFFDDLKVNSEFKHQGLGTCLITELEKIAQTKRCVSINAYMNSAQDKINTFSKIQTRTEFYKALGFKISKDADLNGIFFLSKNHPKFLSSVAQQKYLSNQITAVKK